MGIIRPLSKEIITERIHKIQEEYDRIWDMNIESTEWDYLNYLVDLMINELHACPEYDTWEGVIGKLYCELLDIKGAIEKTGRK